MANIPTTSVTGGTTEGHAGSTASTANTSNLLYIALSFGFSLAVNAWIFFRVSGGLFNPAVSLGMVLVGALQPLRGALLTFSQILGGITVSLTLWRKTPTVPYGRATVLIKLGRSHHRRHHPWHAQRPDQARRRHQRRAGLVHRDVPDFVVGPFARLAPPTAHTNPALGSCSPSSSSLPRSTRRRSSRRLVLVLRSSCVVSQLVPCRVVSPIGRRAARGVLHWRIAQPGPKLWPFGRPPLVPRLRWVGVALSAIKIDAWKLNPDWIYWVGPILGVLIAAGFYKMLVRCCLSPSFRPLQRDMLEVVRL